MLAAGKIPTKPDFSLQAGEEFIASMGANKALSARKGLVSNTRIVCGLDSRKQQLWQQQTREKPENKPVQPLTYGLYHLLVWLGFQVPTM